MYSSYVLNNWLCVNLSRLWVFFPLVVAGFCWINAMNWSRRCLCFLELYYGSRYYSLPASKLLGNFEKILVKRRCPYSNLLFLSRFMLLLLHSTLYLMYSISRFCKFRPYKRFWVRFHLLLLCIYIWFWNLTKFSPGKIEGLDWFWFSFDFEFLFVWVSVLPVPP